MQGQLVILYSRSCSLHTATQSVWLLQDHVTNSNPKSERREPNIHNSTRWIWYCSSDNSRQPMIPGSPPPRRSPTRSSLRFKHCHADFSPLRRSKRQNSFLASSSSLVGFWVLLFIHRLVRYLQFRVRRDVQISVCTIYWTSMAGFACRRFDDAQGISRVSWCT